MHRSLYLNPMLRSKGGNACPALLCCLALSSGQNAIKNPLNCVAQPCNRLSMLLQASATCCEARAAEAAAAAGWAAAKAGYLVVGCSPRSPSQSLAHPYPDPPRHNHLQADPKVAMRV